MNKNLVSDQDYNFYLINSSLLITCLLDNVSILYGEFTCDLPLGVKRLTLAFFPLENEQRIFSFSKTDAR